MSEFSAIMKNLDNIIEKPTKVMKEAAKVYRGQLYINTTPDGVFFDKGYSTDYTRDNTKGTYHKVEGGHQIEAVTCTPYCIYLESNTGYMAHATAIAIDYLTDELRRR